MSNRTTAETIDRIIAETPEINNRIDNAINVLHKMIELNSIKTLDELRQHIGDKRYINIPCQTAEDAIMARDAFYFAAKIASVMAPRCADMVEAIRALGDNMGLDGRKRRAMTREECSKYCQYARSIMNQIRQYADECTSSDNGNYTRFEMDINLGKVRITAKDEADARQKIEYMLGHGIMARMLMAFDINSMPMRTIDKNGNAVSITENGTTTAGTSKKDVTDYEDDQPFTLDDKTFYRFYKTSGEHPDVTYGITAWSNNGSTFAIEWVRANEGTYGEYNPKDPDDKELLRFDLFLNGWNEPSETRCTCCEANATVKEQKTALLEMAKAIVNDAGKTHIKQLCDRLSFVTKDGLGT